jgi:adenosylmethionine-8-amino-7-oxononanoate aminotransferase
MEILHPFSKADNSISIIESCSGQYLKDDTGKKYLDFTSGLYNCGLGYNNKSLNDVVNKAFKKMSFVHQFGAGQGRSQSNIYLEKLTAKLKELIPFANYIHYTNSGAEAVDVAISSCKTLTKHKVISFKNSYHGSTQLSKATSSNLSTETESNIFVDFYTKDSVLTKQEYLNNIEETILKHDPELVSCFVIEPAIGANGGYFMKENILPELIALCKKYNITSIVDEVITGFGRLGKLFAHQLYDIEPDIVVISKQITNGYFPLSACLFTNYPNKEIKYGFTMSGHPVAAAVALTVIKIITAKEFDSNIQKTSKKFHSMLEKIAKFESVKRVEYLSLIHI